MLMNQVVHFKPESGVKISGKDATVGPLVERRKALNQELDAKAKAAGFYNANEPRLIVDGVDKYAPGGREFVDEITSSQNHAYALEKAGDSYAKAKAFEESAAVLRAKIESLRAETVALGSRKFEPPPLFNKPSNGVLVDPEKVRLAQDIESAAKVVHGDLADPTPPVMRPETAAREPIEAPPSMERPAGEQTGPAFEPSTQATIDQLAARHPDMDIELPDGSTVKASELPQKMQQMMAQAESDSKLHDVAVACFLRTV